MKNKKARKKASVVTAAIVTGSLLMTGCSGGQNAQTAVTGDITFPLEETVTLDYWMPLDTKK